MNNTDHAEIVVSCNDPENRIILTNIVREAFVNRGFNHVQTFETNTMDEVRNIDTDSLMHRIVTRNPEFFNVPITVWSAPDPAYITRAAMDSCEVDVGESRPVPYSTFTRPMFDMVGSRNSDLRTMFMQSVASANLEKSLRTEYGNRRADSEHGSRVLCEEFLSSAEANAKHNKEVTQSAAKKAVVEYSSLSEILGGASVSQAHNNLLWGSKYPYDGVRQPMNTPGRLAALGILNALTDLGCVDQALDAIEGQDRKTVVDHLTSIIEAATDLDTIPPPSPPVKEPIEEVMSGFVIDKDSIVSKATVVMTFPIDRVEEGMNVVKKYADKYPSLRVAGVPAVAIDEETMNNECIAALAKDRHAKKEEELNLEGVRNFAAFEKELQLTEAIDIRNFAPPDHVIKFLTTKTKEGK